MTSSMSRTSTEPNAENAATRFLFALFCDGLQEFQVQCTGKDLDEGGLGRYGPVIPRLRSPLEKLTLTSIQLLDDAIYVPLGGKTPIGKPGRGCMPSVVDGGLAPVPWEDLDPAMVQEVQRESSSYTLDVLEDPFRPQEAVETTHVGGEYVVSDAVAPTSPCNVPSPDVVSGCGLSKLPSSTHPDDKTKHDAFFVQTCVVKPENAQFAAPQKPLLFIRGGERLDEDVDP